MTKKAEKIKAYVNTFMPDVGEIGDGLLTDGEAVRLARALPELADLAEEMGCLSKPIIDWSETEILRFLSCAVRVADPIRAAGAIPFNDDIPFGDAA